MEELNIHAVASRAVSGIFALISRQLVINIISLGTALIIYTVLPKEDIGIYTVAIAMQRVISFFTDFGLGAALIQKKEELNDAETSTTFTLQSIITFAIFIIVLILSPFLASFFKLSDSGVMLLLVLVFSIFLSSFKIIPSILLERKIQFKKLIIPQISEVLIFNIILIALVLSKKGLDSYTWAFLISSLISIPIYYYISPWKIKFSINKKSLAHLKFGTQFQAKNILATIKDDLLTVILAKFLTFSEIANIGFAQRLAFFTYRYTVDSVTKVSFSALSRMQDNKEHLRIAIEKSFFFISFIMFPSLFTLMFIAHPLILYFPNWQGKWDMAIPSLIFFSLNALISSFSGILINVLDSTGRVKTTLKLMILWTAMTWTLTPLLIYFYGFNGVAAASFLVTLTIFITTYLVKKIVNFNSLKSIYKPAFATFLLCIALFAGNQLFVHNLLSLIIVIIISGIIYLATMYLIARKEIENDIRLLFQKK
jgi:O-antigen/teichoic acid export membrane protein